VPLWFDWDRRGGRVEGVGVDKSSKLRNQRVWDSLVRFTYPLYAYIPCQGRLGPTATSCCLFLLLEGAVVVVSVRGIIRGGFGALGPIRTLNRSSQWSSDPLARPPLWLCCCERVDGGHIIVSTRGIRFCRLGTSSLIHTWNQLTRGRGASLVRLGLASSSGGRVVVATS
jgi:hypothetical protein